MRLVSRGLESGWVRRSHTRAKIIADGRSQRDLALGIA
jgi:hypothetical protein